MRFKKKEGHLYELVFGGFLYLGKMQLVKKIEGNLQAATLKSSCIAWCAHLLIIHPLE